MEIDEVVENQQIKGHHVRIDIDVLVNDEWFLIIIVTSLPA